MRGVVDAALHEESDETERTDGILSTYNYFCYTKSNNITSRTHRVHDQHTINDPIAVTI